MKNVKYLSKNVCQKTKMFHKAALFQKRKKQMSKQINPLSVDHLTWYYVRLSSTLKGSCWSNKMCVGQERETHRSKRLTADEEKAQLQVIHCPCNIQLTNRRYCTQHYWVSQWSKHQTCQLTYNVINRPQSEFVVFLSHYHRFGYFHGYPNANNWFSWCLFLSWQVCLGTIWLVFDMVHNTWQQGA